jgi:uncharacterized protein (TIGR03067 family)
VKPIRLLLLGAACAGAPLAGGARDTADQDPVAGRWTVVSVEAAGQPVDALKGAELLLDAGKKTFRMPSGATEAGTYALDASRNPRWIDATTEGKSGVQKGIYEIDGKTLRMCFAQAGGERPGAFATRDGADLVLLVLERGGPEPPPASPHTPDSTSIAKVELPRKRAFRMGFTGFVHDITPEAVAASRAFVRENADILAHHIEGVPWAEALADLPFSKDFLAEWEGKRSATPPRGKVYLALSPGRGDLKPAEKAMPIPPELRGKSYDDPLVKKAYLAYCRRAIEFFRPDWLCIGIEVNEIHDSGTRVWNAYVDLHRHVRDAIRKERPELPVFASFTLHNLFKKQGRMLESFEALMEWNDVAAVSYYPFFIEDSKRLSALDWMCERFEKFKKPFAMVETNDAAERLAFPRAGHVIAGTPEKQLRYHEKLFGLAQEKRFLFVIDFIHQDYDRLWERIEASSPELFMAWRDCGLLDEAGKPRPALELWRRWLAVPLGG